MEARIADQNTTKYPLGRLIDEGKTKKIYEVRNNPQLVLIVSKDDITAGDGAKHDILKGKAAWSTATTCNVFELLKREDIALAYIERDNENSFVAYRCDMLPYEVVVRCEAHGSYLKRYPELTKGDRLSPLVAEIFLKTKNRRWRDNELPCDDPLLIWSDEVIRFFHPGKPFSDQAPFLELLATEFFIRSNEGEILCSLMKKARSVFSILHEKWRKEGGRLGDFKVEYGIDQEGIVRLADVIDNDSWRVTMDESYIDKQVYRDGGSLDEVAARYEQVAQITARFLD